MPRFPLEGSGSEDLTPIHPERAGPPSWPGGAAVSAHVGGAVSLAPCPLPERAGPWTSQAAVAAAPLPRGAGVAVGGLAVDWPASSTAAAAVPASESAAGPQAARSWCGVPEPVGAHPLELPPFWALFVRHWSLWSSGEVMPVCTHDFSTTVYKCSHHYVLLTKYL